MCFARQIYWDVSAAQHLLDVFARSPQMILAGPPGTGKSYIAGIASPSMPFVTAAASSAFNFIHRTNMRTSLKASDQVGETDESSGLPDSGNGRSRLHDSRGGFKTFGQIGVAKPRRKIRSDHR